MHGISIPRMQINQNLDKLYTGNYFSFELHLLRHVFKGNRETYPQVMIIFLVHAAVGQLDK